MVLEKAPRFAANFWEGDLCRELLFLNKVGKGGILSGEEKPVAETLEKEVGVHGLRKRRGSDVGALKASSIVESMVRRMPEEDRRDIGGGTRMKEAPIDSGSDGKQKTVERKPPKQMKSTVKAAGRRGPDSSPQPLEDLRAKEDAETNRKVHESLDNFLRTNMRCDSPYLTFSGRPGDKPLPRLRPDVLESHVGGKFGRGFKVDGGSDGRDIGVEDNLGGVDSHPSDVDGVKDMLNASKGISGFSRGTQHSLKVPPGVVAFTQAAAKGTDLPGWPLLSPSKIALTKCDKCPREFCSSLNYRRHVRVHRKSLTEKKDLTKEREKVAEFWDKLTAEQASDIVNYENMEIEHLSGTLLLKALAGYIQQPVMASMAQGLVKAGSALLNIVQNKSTVYPLPSERLLSILDEASEKTFLSGGTSVAYQRFVFNGDAGKVGLEEKNLVASMGFHVEQRLVKAWMADKEAEALRNQQALFKEEEAAQQKRAKLLEKKRMKKLRQKERKVTASQLVQELGNESNDEEGNLPGAEEDDSPTATGSSASSLVSAHDLAQRGTSDMDMNEELGQTEEGRDEEPVFERNKSSDEDSEQLSLGVSPPSGPGMPSFFRHEDLPESFLSGSRKGDYSNFVDSTLESRGSSWSSRNADEVVEDSGREARPAQHMGYYRRSGDVHGRRVDQERGAADYVRRDSDRDVFDRRPLRVSRDRMRSDVYSDVYQKPVRDGRGYDTRYNNMEGGSQSSYKHRKINSFAPKNDIGTSDRSQQYRSKPSGMHRNLPGGGNSQVVWTRKVIQPAAAVEVPRDAKDDTTPQTETDKGEAPNMEGQDLKPEIPDVEESLVPSEAADPTIAVEEVAEPESVAVAPTVLEERPMSVADVVVEPSDSTSSAESQEELYTGALLVGSLCVPIGKYAADKFVQSRSYPTPSYTPQEAQVVNPVVVRNEPLSVEAPDLRLVGRGGSDDAVCVANRDTSPEQGGVRTKSQSPTSGPDGPDSGRTVAPGTGHDRAASKLLSWQNPAGRYVTSKVWRAVGHVGERQDSGSGGDGEGQSLEREMSMAEGGESDAVYDRQNFVDTASGSPVPESVESCAEQVSADEESVRAPVVEADSGGSVDEEAGDTPASGPYQCSWSVFIEVAERFLNERWREAVLQEAQERYADGGAPDVSSQGQSDQGVTHHSGADPLPCSSSSVVTQSSGKAAHDWGVLLSRTSSDSDQTGIEGVTHDHHDDKRLDGAGPGERDVSRASSPGSLATTRDSSPAAATGDSSRGDSEQYTSVVENVRSSTTTSNTAHGPERRAESRAAAGGGGRLGYSHGRPSHTRQERWHRNPRDRGSEQRYMPRRRAPVEKNC